MDPNGSMMIRCTSTVHIHDWNLFCTTVVLPPTTVGGSPRAKKISDWCFKRLFRNKSCSAQWTEITKCGLDRNQVLCIYIGFHVNQKCQFEFRDTSFLSSYSVPCLCITATTVAKKWLCAWEQRDNNCLGRYSFYFHLKTLHQPWRYLSDIPYTWLVCQGSSVPQRER